MDAKRLARRFPRRPKACCSSATVLMTVFQPVTAYVRLRPWDRRGINTFQFFSLVGPKYTMAIIASYMCEEGDIPLRFTVPEGRRPGRVFNGLTDESYTESIRTHGDCIRLTVRTTEPDAVVLVVVEWVEK